MRHPERRPAVSWALYDWANSAFATTVMAGFFPIFFKQYWSQDTAITQSTFYLGVGNSISSLVIVLLAPVLGAMADVGYIDLSDADQAKAQDIWATRTTGVQWG